MPSTRPTARRARGPAALAAFVLLTPIATPEEVRQAAPAEARPGVVHEWQSKDGLAFQYRLPKDRDADAPVTLTVILHGSNLDRRWGFANHRPETFRPHDLVLCPDGTTPNGSGGFNFLGEDDDVERLHRLLEEIGDALPIAATYLYGHSQGSFFALHYAGARPDEVAGVVAHASGLWTWTRTGRDGHRQAIVLMHGSQDPVVPYGQSVGAFEALRAKKYPLLRLRTLEGWNHWPAEHNLDVGNVAIPHASQQLAWCEGMTTDDPARLELAFDTLADVVGEERHDYAALHAVASRVAARDDLPAPLLARAARARDEVEKVAALHAAELPRGPKLEFDGKPWIGHLPLFLRAYGGVPAADELHDALEKTLEKHADAAAKHLRIYWQERNKGDVAAAFAAGVAALDDAFLASATEDRELLAQLEQWADDAKGLKLDKRSMKTWNATASKLQKAREAGAKAFDAIQRKAKVR